MPEKKGFEAERSAWIKSRRWLDKPGAARRAERLARRARQLDRGAAGLDASGMSEGETKGVMAQWTRFDDTLTSALGFLAFVAVFFVYGPIFFGLSWVVGRMAYLVASAGRRVRIIPFLALAAGAGAATYFGRSLGWDLPAIFALAHLLENVTGGLIAPAVLSRWYAAGIIGWLEIELALGFIYAAWLGWAWGWAAPAVRRGHTDGRTTKDRGVKIIDTGGSEKKKQKPASGTDAGARVIETPSSTSEPADEEAIDEPAWSDEDDIDDDVLWTDEDETNDNDDEPGDAGLRIINSPTAGSKEQVS